MKQGLLIAVEGIDGAGKSTLVNGLREELARQDIDVSSTFEPTRDTAQGLRVRALLAQHLDTGMLPENLAASMAELFAQDRALHLQDVVLPALAQGRLVLCDRYLMSSLALQGDVIGHDAVLAQNVGARLPDLTIWLQLPPLDAAARLRKRGGDRSRFETGRALAWQGNAWRAAAGIMRDLGCRVVPFSAEVAPATLLAQVLAVVLDAHAQGAGAPRQVSLKTTESQRPICWTRYRLPALGRDLCMVRFVDRVEVYWRMRADVGEGNRPRRPVTCNAGDLRWRSAHAPLVVGDTKEQRAGGWTYLLDEAGDLHLRAAAGGGGRHGQEIPLTSAGAGRPAFLDEVWGDGPQVKP